MGALLILILALGLTPSSKAEAGTFFEISSDSRQEAYIIPASDPIMGADLDFYFPRHHRWTPTAKDCSEADAAIEQWIAREFTAVQFPARQYRSKINSTDLEERPIETIHRLYSSYGCQFVGILEGDKKLIFANFYLGDNTLQGDKDWVFICDDGPASWQIQYDVNAKSCSNISIETYYRRA